MKRQKYGERLKEGWGEMRKRERVKETEREKEKKRKRGFLREHQAKPEQRRAKLPLFSFSGGWSLQPQHSIDLFPNNLQKKMKIKLPEQEQFSQSSTQREGAGKT